MEPTPQPLYRSAAYVNGQVMATQALLFVLARAQPNRTALLAAMAQAIESLRTAVLPSAMPDDFLLGIEHMEQELARQVPYSKLAADEP